MRWENLTYKQFEDAVVATDRVCVVPFGILEKHGDHLPLGTDMMIASAVAEKAAAIEPVVLFPDYLLGQNSGVKHWPGSVAFSGETQLRMLKEICQEIRRNGFNKIIILNGHGGNNELLSFFLRTTLDEKKDYMVYGYWILNVNAEQQQRLNGQCEAPDRDGHAGHTETAAIMHLLPNLVHMDRVTPGEWEPKGRGRWLREHGLSSGIHWYSEFPNQISGDPLRATAEYGKSVIDILVDNFVKAIRKVKADDTLLQLQAEFFDRCDRVENI